MKRLTLSLLALIVVLLVIFFGFFEIKIADQTGFVHLPMTDGHVFTLYRGYDGNFISHIWATDPVFYFGYRPQEDDRVRVLRFYISSRLRDETRFPGENFLTIGIKLKNSAHVEFSPG